MSADEFEKTLRELYHREPFQQFVIELTDGREVVVEQAGRLAFAGGGAGYVAFDQIHLIECEEVARIRSAGVAA